MGVADSLSANFLSHVVSDGLEIDRKDRKKQALQSLIASQGRSYSLPPVVVFFLPRKCENSPPSSQVPTCGGH